MSGRRHHRSPAFHHRANLKQEKNQGSQIAFIPHTCNIPSTLFLPLSFSLSLPPSIPSCSLSLRLYRFLRTLAAAEHDSLPAYFVSWIFKLDIKGAKSPQDRFHEGFVYYNPHESGSHSWNLLPFNSSFLSFHLDPSFSLSCFFPFSGFPCQGEIISRDFVNDEQPLTFALLVLHFFFLTLDHFEDRSWWCWDLIVTS